MNNKDILKYINKLLSKKNKNKKKIKLNDISKIYLKEKRKKDKIKILLFNDLQKIDEFEDNAKFSLKYINQEKALKIEIPFKTYGKEIFLFSNTGKLHNINSNDYMLTNLIIKNAHSNIKKAIKIFESDYKNMKDKKRIKLRGSIFKVDINNREIKLFYNNFEIIKVLEKNRFIIKSKNPKIIQKLKGEEEEIFDKVYININKCPFIIKKNIK